MPDPDSSPPVQAVKRPRDYSISSPPATSSLARILKDRMDREGPMDFADFMAAALYEPGLGYYARTSQQVGRGGDFFTSVSVGPLFGALLARRFLREWRETGSPSRWRIIECGAHDGTLASDVLTEIMQLDSHAFAALEYVIPEPLPQLQETQRMTLDSFSGKIHFIGNAAELSDDALPGIAFGNEVLDALPFHLVEWRGKDWFLCRVASGVDGNFTWEKDPPVADWVSLGNNFPVGYRTEVRRNYREFFEPLTRCLSSGLLIWPDYGFARPEYYHPDRKNGTIRTFSKHHAEDNPLVTPGEIDITAHVDFTALAEAALSLGCTPVIFKNQGAWLTEAARDWLLSYEGNPDATSLRQFQTLTHPAHLGACFQVIELAWNQPEKMTSATDWNRLCLPFSQSLIHSQTEP